jgi:AcrR family transcriptional regulator
MSVPKPRRTQAERREEAEKRLLDASVRLLVERGYDRFALADVCEKAGYSRGLAAHHFENKEGLLEALAMHIVEGFAKGISKLAPAAPGWETITRGIRYYTASPTRNPLMFRAYMVILAEAALQPKLGVLAADIHRRAIASLVANLEEGKKGGMIRPDTDSRVNAETIYAFQRGVLTLARIETGIDVFEIVENFIAAMGSYLCVAVAAPPTASKRRK